MVSKEQWSPAQGEAADAASKVSSENDREEITWGKAFVWEIRGAGLERVWSVVADFEGVHKWATSLLQDCELVEGEPNKAGCVRRVLLHPLAPGQPCPFTLEKLEEIDPLHHHYTYSLLATSVPVFSHIEGYVSTLELSPSNCSPTISPNTTNATITSIIANTTTITPLVGGVTSSTNSTTHNEESATILLRWTFASCPCATLSKEDAINNVFLMYTTAINDLKAHLSLLDENVTLIS